MDWRTVDLLARPRTACMVRDADCEVFTRCVRVKFLDGALDACPTCAEQYEAAEGGEES